MRHCAYAFTGLSLFQYICIQPGSYDSKGKISELCLAKKGSATYSLVQS